MLKLLPHNSIQAESLSRLVRQGGWRASPASSFTGTFTSRAAINKRLRFKHVEINNLCLGRVRKRPVCYQRWAANVTRRNIMVPIPPINTALCTVWKYLHSAHGGLYYQKQSDRREGRGSLHTFELIDNGRRQRSRAC
jgi:hypothetical protein